MDPFTLALIGAGVAGGGSLIGGIFGAIQKEKEIKAMREMQRERMAFFREQAGEARQRVGARIDELLGEVQAGQRRIETAGRRAEELLRSGYSEFRAGLSSALEEFRKETGVAISEARERVGKEYDIAMGIAEHLARSEIQRRMEALGFGAGAGATAIMQQRAVMEAILPILTEKGRQVATLERDILGMRERVAERGLGVAEAIAGSRVEEARGIGELGMRTAGAITELGIRGRETALAETRALEQAIFGGATRMEFSPSAYYRVGVADYLAGIGEAMQAFGTGLASGAGAGGGGGRR